MGLAHSSDFPFIKKPYFLLSTIKHYGIAEEKQVMSDEEDVHQSEITFSPSQPTQEESSSETKSYSERSASEDEQSEDPGDNQGDENQGGELSPRSARRLQRKRRAHPLHRVIGEVWMKGSELDQDRMELLIRLSSRK